MKKWKGSISLLLFIMLLMSVLSNNTIAEEELIDRIKSLTQSVVTGEKENEPLADDKRPASDEVVVVTKNQEQSFDDTLKDETDDFDSLKIKSRSSFVPDLMVAKAGTRVYSDNRLSTLMGEIKITGVIYAVSLTGNSVRIAFVVGKNVLEGYVSQSALSAMSADSKDSYLKFASKGVKVYTQKLVAVSFDKTVDAQTTDPITTTQPVITKPTVTPTAKVTVSPTPIVTKAPTAMIPSNYPVIEDQPKPVYSLSGEYAVFSVKVSNVKTYQWQYSSNKGVTWSDVSGSSWIGGKQKTLGFIYQERYNGFLFRCKLTNNAGTVYTNAVELDTKKKTSLPSIVSQPMSVSVTVGETVSFQIAASDASKYQWQYSQNNSTWTDISGSGWSGSTAPNLSFSASRAYDRFFFRCAVSNSVGTVYSNTVSLSVNITVTASPKATPTMTPKVTPTAAPTTQQTIKPTVSPETSIKSAPVFDSNINTFVSGAVNSYVKLTANVSGATSYQWQINPNLGLWTMVRESSTYQNTTTPTLVLKLNSNSFSYTYRLKATNAYGVSYSPEFSIGELIDVPANVRAVASRRHEIDVTWDASPSSNVNHYKIYYNTASLVDYSCFVTSTSNSATLKGLISGTTYYIWVQAIGDKGLSDVDSRAYSTVTTLASPLKPGAPTSVSANASATSLFVSWKKPTNSEVDGYTVYYRLYSSNNSKTTEKLTINGENALSATLTSLSPNTSYQVWVCATNEAGEGVASSSIIVKTLEAAPAPAQPTNVKAASYNSTSVKVSWNLSSSNDVAGYNVYYSTSTSLSGVSKLENSYNSASTSAIVSGLKVGTTYYFWVTAYNQDGIESDLNASVRASAAPKAVSTSNKINAVTFSQMGDKYIGTGYSVYDCQAFVERMLADAGLYVDLAGSNAWYRVMNWRGTPEQCIATFGCIPTGAFLFILKHDGGEPSHYRDSLGNASHIGVVTHRNGGAIHSSYSKGRVCTSVFNDATIPNGGWNMVGLWTRMDYGDTVNSILESLTGR